MTGFFALFMFIARFLVEFIKEPQSAFEEEMLLNMGQILSIPAIIAGIGFMVYAFRSQHRRRNKDAEPRHPQSKG